ncbi:sugar/carbohydrate kinase [Dunaliella salina]|uniref:Sugar/carbohydrate kinase n=1 Tax=Dunaliella salina TaxID=3046 RepID=A0ABQ7G8G3_DUNSA|nr:sugar/carbohydrate kinase [Dunaliella salina]|eukprot:KAF5830892.1 sugar/carbohydrate kinase [Dunaliella salina]
MLQGLVHSPVSGSLGRQCAWRKSAPCVNASRPWRRGAKRCPKQQSALKLCAQQYDVVGLGNLCVDVISPVDSLPKGPKNMQMLDELNAGPLDETSWEVGGNCNFLIAAARMGLRTASVGHAGCDVYGDFLAKTLHDEGVEALERIAPPTSSSDSADGTYSSPTPEEAALLQQTLICFVLVDPLGRHAFCSLYDFGPWPLLRGINHLPRRAMELVESARTVFVNGFIFDELRLDVVQEACQVAMQKGGAVFFDPGPRCFTMMEGSRRVALDTILNLSTVVLLTEEEAAVVTGQQKAEAAARSLLSRKDAFTRWCVVKQGAHGATLASKDPANGAITIHQSPGFKVAVQDTVGCGDSFASAVVLGYNNSLPIPLTLALANAVGAATAMGRGAGRSVAKAEQVRALLLRCLDGVHHEQRMSQAYSDVVLRQAINIVQAQLDLAHIDRRPSMVASFHDQDMVQTN